MRYLIDPVNNIFVNWHSSLEYHKNEWYQLRGCKYIDQVFLTPAYIRLKFSLKKNNYNVTEKNQYIIAIICICLAQLDQENHKIYQSLPTKMGKLIPPYHHPITSEFDFIKLLSTKKEKTIFDLLLSIVKRVKDFDFEWFARDLLAWDKKTKISWAEQYYIQLIKEEK